MTTDGRKIMYDPKSMICMCFGELGEKFEEELSLKIVPEIKEQPYIMSFSCGCGAKSSLHIVAMAEGKLFAFVASSFPSAFSIN